ncbi:VOC family protein [Streptomyces sp. NPDC000963]
MTSRLFAILPPGADGFRIRFLPGGGTRPAGVLGATRAEEGDDDRVTMLDPDGNEFCVRMPR